MTASTAGAGTPQGPTVGSVQTWVRFLAGFLVLCGVLMSASAVDATGRWGLGILAVVLLPAVVLEMLRDRRSLPATLCELGLGRPGGRTLAVAVAVSGLVLLVYPTTAVATGSGVHLRHDWPWLLIGIFAFHGVAEELVWRGFTFHRLREGRSFWSAASLTMPLIAASHLPILLDLGPAIGLGAMAVAMVTSVPFAYLYETGRNTIWAPALVHTAIDTFKLVVIPAAAVSTFSLLLIAVSLTVPLLALAVPRRLLMPDSGVGHRSGTASAKTTTRYPTKG